MELRTLRYFLAVIQEGSITNASKRLHVTQPTLSRQLADLERELGRPLYTRSHTGITPTEYGAILVRYAESIVGLAAKAEEDIKLPSKTVAGTVHIGCGETRAMELLADAMVETRTKYPDVSFELHSGTSADLSDGLVRGQYDFLLECELQPHVAMNVLELPHTDRWGAIVLHDDPLAKLPAARADDLIGRQLIVSHQAMRTGKLHTWLQDGAPHGALEAFDVAATYSLAMNCKFLVRRGVGVALTYEDLIDGADSDLIFIPLAPALTSRSGLVWRKTLPSRQAQVFLDAIHARVEREE